MKKWIAVSPELSCNDQWGVAINDAGYKRGIGIAYIVHEVGQDHEDDQGERIARLIAAAPEMLKALKQIKKWLLMGDQVISNKNGIYLSAFVKAHNLAIEAIAKAEVKP